MGAEPIICGYVPVVVIFSFDLTIAFMEGLRTFYEFISKHDETAVVTIFAFVIFTIAVKLHRRGSVIREQRERDSWKIKKARLPT